MENIDFLDSFIEDSREHLDDIEVTLMDLEQADDQSREELVNTVFRAAHSIKGSASFLGLLKVRDLAHRLENILHLARNGEITLDKRIVSSLLSGFDLLKNLVAMGTASEQQDIRASLAELDTLTGEILPAAHKGQQEQPAPVGLPGGPALFTLDQLSLHNALSGGKFLYLVEYDLIHDVHARGKTPLDIIRTMESSGLIVDCRIDLGPVGDLEAPLSNKLPFFVLFATIVEPDVIGYLFALDTANIHLLDPRALNAAPRSPGVEPLFGFPCVTQGDTSFLAAPAELTLDRLEDLRQALLAVLAQSRDAVLDLGAVATLDTALVQLLCSAEKTFAQAGRLFSLAPAHDIPPLAERLARLGFPTLDIARCDSRACPFPS